MSEDKIESDVLARISLKQAEVFCQMRKGIISPDQFESVLQSLIDNPSPSELLPKNKSGRYAITVKGLNLKSEGEIYHLVEEGHSVDSMARSVFRLGNQLDGYNRNHLLREGEEYRVVFIRGREVGEGCTMEDVRSYAYEFGYRKPLAGIMPRLLESLTASHIKRMDVDEIVCPHTGIQLGTQPMLPAELQVVMPAFLSIRCTTEETYLSANQYNHLHRFEDSVYKEGGVIFPFIDPHY